MLATDEFVLVHVPKTGGTFLKTLIREHVDDTWEPEDYHLPYAQLPDHLKALPAVCFIRNPWDWYVSWYYHHRRESGLDLEFGDFIRLAFTKQPDVYTRYFSRMRARQVSVRRYERLREEFVAFLDEHAVGNGSLRAAVLEAPPIRVSERTHYRDYYDAQTQAIVGRCRLARRYEF